MQEDEEMVEMTRVSQERIGSLPKATGLSFGPCGDIPCVGNTVAWENISYSITLPDGSEKKLIQNVTGVAVGGRLHALMGASGAGKTVTMDSIAGNISGKNGRMEGQFLVNGKPRDHRFKGIRAYVMQEDELYGDLTVFENLYFAALLRLPSSMPNADKRARVDKVLSKLGLDVVRDHAVGSPFRAGISTSQRKLASIGVGLITNPKIIFLDEPTSGLDSTSAWEVVRVLRKLADEEKRTVIATIHQPSTALFNQFDDLTLLARGMLVYTGPREGAVAYFSDKGLAPDRFTSPADHYLDVINYDFYDLPPGKEHPDEIMTLVNDLRDSRYFACAAKAIATSKECGTGEGMEDAAKDGNASKYTNSFTWQTWVLMLRTFRLFIKNPGIVWFRFAMYLMLSVVMGLVFLKLKHVQSEIRDRIASLFFASAFMTFMSVGAVPAYIADRVTFVRERMNASYHVGAYVLANTIVQLPFVLLLALCTTPFYFLADLRADGFIVYILTLFLALMVSESLMGVLSSIVPSFVLSSALAAAVFGAFMLTQGFLRLKRNLPGFWIWLYYGSFHRYSFEIMMRNEFLKGDPYPCDPQADQPLYADEAMSVQVGSFNGTYCSFPSQDGLQVRGEDVLRFYEYDNVNITTWSIALIVFAVALRIMYYLLMRFRNKGQR